jgi:hypothetical protein
MRTSVERTQEYVGFEVFTAVVMKSTIFWDITPCSPLSWQATCLLDGLLNYSLTLEMEAMRSSETSGASQLTTRRHIPKYDTLRRKNMFSYRADRVTGGAD